MIWPRNLGSWLRASALSVTRSVTTLVASPPWMKPTLRGAAVLALLDQAVPAAAGQVGDGQRGDGDGADASLGADAGVAGEPFDLDRHPVAAGRADRHLLAAPPSQLKHIAGLPSRLFCTQRAPYRPISS